MLVSIRIQLDVAGWVDTTIARLRKILGTVGAFDGRRVENGMMTAQPTSIMVFLRRQDIRRRWWPEDEVSEVSVGGRWVVTSNRGRRAGGREEAVEDWGTGRETVLDHGVSLGPIGRSGNRLASKTSRDRPLEAGLETCSTGDPVIGPGGPIAAFCCRRKKAGTEALVMSASS